MSNFILTEDINFFPKTPTEKVNANLAAIKLAKELTNQNMQATFEQQQVLAKYVGWGGLANKVFDEFNIQFKEQRDELKKVVTEFEYNMMKESSLTAYYTEPAITKAMWSKLLNDGLAELDHANILDPSMGTGLFFMTMPQCLQERVNQGSFKLYGVELDPITGMIAKLLFPKAQIEIKGFQDVKFKEDTFDVVISNIPFENIRVLNEQGNKSYMIHDYFMKKAVSLTKEFGQVAVIASTGVMDKRTNNIVPELLETSSFLGGLRLPSKAFKQLGGTTVTTDILFFQKDYQHVAANFNNRTEVSEMNINGEFVYINKYFQADNSHIGTYKVKFFHGKTLTTETTDDSWVNTLEKQLNTSVRAAYYGFKSKLTPMDDNLIIPVDKSTLSNYEFSLKQGDIWYKEPNLTLKNAKLSVIERIEDESGNIIKYNATQAAIQQFEKSRIIDNKVAEITKGKYKGMFKATYFWEEKYNHEEITRITGMIKLKNIYRKLIKLQLDPNFSKSEFKSLLNELNTNYDSFVTYYGNINDKANSNLFETDNYYPLIASLENEEVDELGNTMYTKSDAFKKPLVNPKQEYKQVKTAHDALLTSVTANRGVDFDFMQALYPKTKEEIITELGDEILPNLLTYANSQKIVYIDKNEALSGDILTKLKLVDRIKESEDSSYNWEHYEQLLNNVKPKYLTLADIYYRLASDWIPDEIVTKFVTQFCDVPITNDKNLIIRKYTGEREIYPSFVNRYRNDDKAIKYQIRRDGKRLFKYENVFAILNLMLNGKQQTITEKVGETADGKPIIETDEVSTATLRRFERELEQKFKDFILNNDENADLVEKAYNEKFNRIVNKQYNGSHMLINGLVKNIHLRDYQKNAVMRIVTERRALLAHEVGMGKTLTMISAAFKLKELGIAKKPLFVVPTNLTAQFGQDILRFYPTKKVLVTTKADFSKINRKRFLGRIINSDYDAIVMGHSQFEKIEVSLDHQKVFYEDKINELLRNIKEAKNTNKSFTIKEMQRKIKALRYKLATIQARVNKRQDKNYLSFEELGIDFMFVDEAHNYKNIAPNSNLGQIKGINSTTSQRAFDMEMKVDIIHKNHSDCNVVFATGTPVSNSISELWIMMNYIQPDVLAKFNLSTFDSFANNFGLIKYTMELNTTGNKYKPQKRFMKFVNLPELMSIYRITTDIKLGNQLTNVEIPKGKQIVVPSELTEEQQEKLNELIKRSELMETEFVDPKRDNMLKITGEARKLTLDMRLLNTEDKQYGPGNADKLPQAADNIYRIYKRTNKMKGTQIVFSDLGTPNKKKFNVYDELKQLLVNLGIPQKEIEYMHTADTDEKKNLLQQKVNQGKIRVLIGSTTKGGTGFNVQQRMKAVHHLDVPWRPSDLIQRNGRLVRNGNIFQEVEIYQYITKGSFDNYLWQIQENKLRYITQVMTSKSAIRAMNDIDEETMTASEFKAIATQNPYLKHKMEIDNKVNLLKNQKNANLRNARAQSKRYHDTLPLISKLSEKIDKTKLDVEFAKAQKAFDTAIMFNDGSVFDNNNDTAAKLKTEIWQAIRNNSTDKPIGTMNGFNLFVKDKGVTQSGRTVDLVLSKNAAHIVRNISLTMWTDYHVVIKLRNKLVNLENELEHDINALAQYQTIIKQGKGDETFKQEDELNYLIARLKVINPLINNESTASNVELIKNTLADFEIKWKQTHPEFTQVDLNVTQQKQTSAAEVAEKFKLAMTNFNDSVFEDIYAKMLETKPTEPKKTTVTKTVAKVTVNKSKPRIKVAVTQTIQNNTEELDLFSFVENTNSEEITKVPTQHKQTIDLINTQPKVKVLEQIDIFSLI